MNRIHKNENQTKNDVREHLISYLRNRLTDHSLLLTEETLADTAERYASMITNNPKLNAAKLLDKDITKITELLRSINKTS